MARLVESAQSPLHVHSATASVQELRRSALRSEPAYHTIRFRINPVLAGSGFVRVPCTHIFAMHQGLCKLDLHTGAGSILSLRKRRKGENKMAIQPRAAALKQEIEGRLASRIPAALSPQVVQAARLLPLGIEAVNHLLDGGLPVGGICEFTGPATAGRTSLALSFLSEASVDSACAYIDVSDSLDARSAAAAGVRLENLLWVRFTDIQEPRQRQSAPASYPIVKAVTQDRQHGSTQHSGSRHPRTETKGMDRALEKMLVQKAESRLKKMEATPGFPNQRLSLAVASEEQITYDRFNARRADDSDPLRQIDRKAADDARERANMPTVVRNGLRREERPWGMLDKALRTADQILQAGGFRVIVLDLASVSPEQALRIPSATWYRFSRAAQEGDATLLLLTQEPCARSSAKCVLDCSPRKQTGEHGNVLGGITNVIEVVRQRVANLYGKKAPGRAVEWNATAPWMRAVGKMRLVGR
jgi:recombination protein RecA